MRIIKFVPALFILFISFQSYETYAQENIVTTRPTSAISAWTLPTNSFQFEQGFTYDNDTLVLDGLFRLAFSKIAEIRITTNYSSDLIGLGTKVMLLDPENHKTGLAVSLAVDGDFIVQDLRFIITQALTERYSVFGNFGVTPGGRWYSMILFNIGLGDKFATYLEADLRDGFQQYNTGLTYLINSETQLDFSAGLKMNNSEHFGYDDGYYVGVGFARRLKFDQLIH